MFTTFSRFWKGRSAQFGHVLSKLDGASLGSVRPKILPPRRWTRIEGTMIPGNRGNIVRSLG
jgi:hypothetical protein